MTADTWVHIPPGSDFTLANLPYGVFADDAGARCGVAIGRQVVDLAAAHSAGLLEELPERVFAGASLNAFAALGPEAWGGTRRRLVDLLSDPGAAPRLRLIDQSTITMRLPMQIGDFVDFYSSEHHAANVGKMFRPDQEPLPPNWRHLPIGYHGRASSVVVSGTPIRRPHGQRRPRSGDRPTFGPSRLLDIELEVGFYTGPGNRHGEPIPVAEAEDHIFGLCLVNDWSARDLQAWEYVPLGPFLGKSFATTVSPWVVPLHALQGHRVAPPPQDPPVLPYLQTTGPTGVALDLTVDLNGTTISRTGFGSMYWSMAQQLAHATSNGASTRPGDLFASGTVSGPGDASAGSLLELSWNGTRTISLDDGDSRTFLEDGDTVTMRAECGTGGDRIGFGPCVGTVLQTG